MTATTVANNIVDEIESGTYYGAVMGEPRTVWCSWENDFNRFVITLFSPRPAGVISRDEMDDMVGVFDSRLNVRLSYIQGFGILVVETFFTESGQDDTKDMIFRDDESNSVIDR